jgi:hypothetical protein
MGFVSLPGKTMIRSEPNICKVLVTALLMPLLNESITTTRVMPMMMPKTVSQLLNGL